jgi:hypothetical protein
MSLRRIPLYLLALGEDGCQLARMIFLIPIVK